MAKSFENLDNILHDWEKDKNKKSIVEALNRYEKHKIAGKRMIKQFSFLEIGTEKTSPAVRRRARLNQTQNWLVSRELLLNKPNKQNVYEIDSFNRGIHADVIVYIFAHLHRTLRTEGNMLDTNSLQVAKELVKLNTL